MSNPDRDYDKTHLSIDVAEERGLIHRDYIAHCFRWSHVAKFLMQSSTFVKGKKNYEVAKILDIGCGKETPLAKTLYSNRMSGAVYMGCDMNKLELAPMLQKAVENGKMEIYLHEKCDASELTLDQLPHQPNVITSFEVFEHVHPGIANRMVRKAFALLEPGGHMFFSTPAWNGKAAANHINETTYRAMGALLEHVGFRIHAHFGTFASISDYKDQLDGSALDIFEGLRAYYDTNVLATIFAPIFPHLSRNVFWHCVKNEKPSDFFEWPDEQWSQHKDWKDLKHD